MAATNGGGGEGPERAGVPPGMAENVIPLRSDPVPAYELPEFMPTTESVAAEFAKRHRDELRYVQGFGSWMHFAAGHWQMDRTGRAVDLAGALCRDIAMKRPKERKRVEMWGFVSGIEVRARAMKRLAADVDVWDTNVRILNCPGGTVELDTGEVRPHRRLDYCSKCTAATPAPVDAAACPLWMRFLERITGGNADLQAFLQRMFGYCLTGLTIEQALFFLYGTGQNGKGVFLQTLAAIMHDYAQTAAIETFVAGQFEHHPEELAVLRGARLVTAVETEQGKSWSESKVKVLTGGDKIRARFMRADSFEYQPQFKLAIAGNHKPALRSIDKAIKRRMHLLPFLVTIPDDERDDTLGEQLRHEWPGILRWGIDGAMSWMVQGLDPPAVVRDATTEYLESEDELANWIADECRDDPQAFTATSALYASWRRWAEDRGEYIGSMRAFAQGVQRKGYVSMRTMTARGFRGIALKPLTATTQVEMDHM